MSDIPDESNDSTCCFFREGAAADIWLCQEPAIGSSTTQVPKLTRTVRKIMRVVPEYFQGTETEQGEEILARLHETFVEKFGLWKSLCHPGLAPLNSAIPSKLTLYQDYYPNGTLREYAKQGISDHASGSIIRDVLDGLTYLHGQEHPIAHGSINPGKIYITLDGRAKIGEFSLSRLTWEFPHLVPSISSNDIVRWMSPEYFGSEPDAETDDMPPTTSLDIWSFGCTLFEVVTGRLPYHQCKYDAQIIQRIINGDLPSYPNETSHTGYNANGRAKTGLAHSHTENIWELIEKCWLPVEQRASAKELLTKYPKIQPEYDWSVPQEGNAGVSSLGGTTLGSSPAPRTDSQSSHSVPPSASLQASISSDLAPSGTSHSVEPLAPVPYIDDMREHKLALTYRTEGPIQWDKAESIQVRTLEGGKQVPDWEHLGTLDSTHNLAMTYQGQGRWDKAEPMHVLDAYKRLLGEEHRDTLASMNNLAMTYHSQGRWDRAESIQLQVLDALKRVLGEENPATLTNMNNLALTYQKQGRWDKAESIQLQVLDAYKRVLGEEHPDTLISMNNLAMTYHNQDRWVEAESVQLQVLDAQKRVLGEENPATLTSMNNLALTYQKQGRWDKAESTQLQVLDALERVIGDEHPDTLISMNNLAMTYHSQGRWDKAESIQLQVLDAQKRVLGEENPATLTSMNNLALAYQKQGRWDKAESIQLQVLDALKRVLGEEHPDTLISMNNLAMTCHNQDRWDKAESMQLQVLDAQKRVLGEENLATLTSMNNLALTYQKQGRWDKAELMQLQVLHALKRVLGEEHPDTLISMNNLAMTYHNQGRWVEAESVQFQALNIRKRALGEEHPDTLVSMRNLALIYRNQGRLGEAESMLARPDKKTTF